MFFSQPNPHLRFAAVWATKRGADFITLLARDLKIRATWMILTRIINIDIVIGTMIVCHSTWCGDTPGHMIKVR